MNYNKHTLYLVKMDQRGILLVKQHLYAHAHAHTHKDRQ